VTRLTLTLDDRSAARLRKLAERYLMPPGVVASYAIQALHELTAYAEETERLRAIKQQFRKKDEG